MQNIDEDGKNDLDYYVGKTGSIGLNTNRTHAPFTYGTVFSFGRQGNAGYSMQIAQNASSGNKFAMRMGTGEWEYFTMQPYLNSYPDLSSLASALGAMSYKGQLSLQTDIISLETGFYLVPKSSIGGVPANLPVEQDGILLKFRYSPSQNTAFYIFATTVSGIYYSVQWFAGSISAWRLLKE